MGPNLSWFGPFLLSGLGVGAGGNVPLSSVEMSHL